MWAAELTIRSVNVRMGLIVTKLHRLVSIAGIRLRRSLKGVVVEIAHNLLRSVSIGAIVQGSGD